MSPADPPGPGHAYGDIVLVSGLLDPQGRNPKDRPCVVVGDPKAPAEGTLLVVAISTVLPDPLPDDYVPLPYHRPWHPRTGLNKRNAAVGRWVQEVERSRILRKVGIVPGKQLVALAEVLRRLARSATEGVQDP